MFWSKKVEEKTIQEQKPLIKSIEITKTIQTFLISLETLSLEQLESYALTLNTYTRGLIKDIGNYSSNPLDAEKRIIAKIKSLAGHALKLQEYLTLIEEEYYKKIFTLLNSLFTQTQDQDILLLHQTYEQELQSSKELQEKITKILSYETSFNPEKNPEYKKSIEIEAAQTSLQQELSSLSSHLTQLLDKKHGIKAKITASPLASLKHKF